MIPCLLSKEERRYHHWVKKDEDLLYYLGEYESEGNSKADNSLVRNFKKTLDRPKTEQNYKKEAIERITHCLNKCIPKADKLIFIPIPPSKSENDDLFDDRMVRVLKAWKQMNPNVKYIDCLRFDGKLKASHMSSNDRPNINTLYDHLSFSGQESQIDPSSTIIIFDDMLTTGAHYLAVKKKLKEKYPKNIFKGVFIFRRILQSPFEKFDDNSRDDA